MYVWTVIYNGGSKYFATLRDAIDFVGGQPITINYGTHEITIKERRPAKITSANLRELIDLLGSLDMNDQTKISLTHGFFEDPLYICEVIPHPDNNSYEIILGDNEI